MRPGTVSAVVTSDGPISLALLEELSGCQKGDSLFDKQESQSSRSRVVYLPAGNAILPEKSTVKEALTFHTQLSGMSERGSCKVVSKIISNLNLQLLERTLIAELTVPERARARVAIALVGRPAVLLLDSPLNGLDVYEAFRTVAVLKQVAVDLQTAVFLSVAQPSSEVLFSLDEVSFVSQRSRMFRGPPSTIVAYFGQLGYSCPPSYSPSDFLLFLFEVVPPEEHDRLVSAWQWHAGNQLDFEIRKDAEEDRGDMFDICDNEFCDKNKKKSPPLTPVAATSRVPSLLHRLSVTSLGDRIGRVALPIQFSTLYLRELKFFYRSIDSLLLRIGLLGLLTALMSLIMFGIGSQGRAMLADPSADTYDVDAAMNNYYGAIAFMVIIALSGNLEAVTVSIPSIRTLFVAEQAMANIYGIAVFTVTQLCIELPTTFVCCFVQVAIGYWTIGLAGSFIAWVAVVFLTAVTTSSVGWFVSCATESPLTALQLMPIVFVPQILFSGLLTNFELIPTWISWMERLCYLKYCINIAFLVEMKQYLDEGSVPAPISDLEFRNSIDEDNKLVYILVTICISILSRIGAVVALFYYRKRSRSSPRTEHSRLVA